jgi:hypothetical protein
MMTLDDEANCHHAFTVIARLDRATQYAAPYRLDR